MMKVISAEDVARLAQQSISASDNMAKQLREMGEAAESMGHMFNLQCQTVADEVDRRGMALAGGLQQFAQTILDQGQQVAALQRTLSENDPVRSDSGTRPPEADIYGIRRVAIEGQNRQDR